MRQVLPSKSATLLGWAVSAASRLSSRFALAIEGLREHWMLRQELGQLEAHGDLERVLTDAGISRSDLPHLTSGHPGAARQLNDMMEHVGIDSARLPPTTAPGATLREMQWKCASCETWRECREWLASHATDNRYRAFCPNAHALDALAEGQASDQPEGHAEGACCCSSFGILRELEQIRGQAL